MEYVLLIRQVPLSRTQIPNIEPLEEMCILVWKSTSSELEGAGFECWWTES